MTAWVAGVDGCKTGWVVVLHDSGRNSFAARLVPDFAAVITLPEAPSVIAVDVPIGLLDTASAGGRACEVLARQLLRTRTSSVFSAPTRAALAAFRAGSGYQAVSTANRGGVATAPGLSQQTFGILPKIDVVDAALSPASQGVVREVCFAEANAGTPMTHSKKTTAGRAERAKLLGSLGFVAPLQLLGTKLPKGANRTTSSTRASPAGRPPASPRARPPWSLLHRRWTHAGCGWSCGAEHPARPPHLPAGRHSASLKLDGLKRLRRSSRSGRD
jgi:predicted RNase H-like nuclease